VQWQLQTKQYNDDDGFFFHVAVVPGREDKRSDRSFGSHIHAKKFDNKTNNWQ
jgi:hypothetical protein